MLFFFFGGGGGRGNVYNLCYTLTLPLSEGLHLLFSVLYNVASENHSVQNGGGGGGL